MNFAIPMLMANPLKLFWNFFFQNLYFQQLHQINSANVDNGLKKPNQEENAQECAVCLCTIAEREETKELRCNHIFHKVCLDRWFGYGQVTCPLCRCSSKSCIYQAKIGEEEVLSFSFLDSFSSGNQKSSWWLR
ncbi:hypothetical protein ACH5RR_036054 [Cinchona calisaya]|uniref:RING-type domain-containing protein n=1 Tax=Cinchona calisaya TaxID=153742 RepID=A0ABD2Y470_9GENT